MGALLKNAFDLSSNPADCGHASSQLVTIEPLLQGVCQKDQLEQKGVALLVTVNESGEVIGLAQIEQ